MAHGFRAVRQLGRAGWPDATGGLVVGKQRLFHKAAVLWNVLHHLDDPGRLFGEMLRVLQPGGKLVLADFSLSGFRLMDEIHAAEGRRHPQPPSRFPHWLARLRRAGFAVRRVVACHEEVLMARRPTA